MKTKLTPKNRAFLMAELRGAGFEAKTILSRGNYFLVRARRVAELGLVPNTPYSDMRFERGAINQGRFEPI